MSAIELLLLLQKPPQCNRYARPRTGPFVLWHSGQLASGVKYRQRRRRRMRMMLMVQLRLREKVTIDRSRSTVVVLLMTFHIANCTKTKLSAAHFGGVVPAMSSSSSFVGGHSVSCCACIARRDQIYCPICHQFIDVSRSK